MSENNGNWKVYKLFSYKPWSFGKNYHGVMGNSDLFSDIKHFDTFERGQMEAEDINHKIKCSVLF